MRIITLAAAVALSLASLVPAARAGDRHHPHNHGPVGRGYPAQYAPRYYDRGPERCDHGHGYVPGRAFYPPTRPIIVVPPPAPIYVPAPRPYPYPHSRSGFSFSLNVIR